MAPDKVRNDYPEYPFAQSYPELQALLQAN
jgi:hypothetical protein